MMSFSKSSVLITYSYGAIVPCDGWQPDTNAPVNLKKVVERGLRCNCSTLRRHRSEQLAHKLRFEGAEPAGEARPPAE